jgi:hypothetical protein
MKAPFWKSKKFWAAIAAVVGTVASALGGAITWPEAINAIVAAVSAYIIGQGIADHGTAIAAKKE